jgi:hypothetical protein
MQIDPQLSIELISEDTDFEQLRITAGNGQYGGSALVYFPRGQISALADALQGFPKTPSQVEIFEGGSDDGARAKLTFHCKDRMSHARYQNRQKPFCAFCAFLWLKSLQQ